MRDEIVLRELTALKILATLTRPQGEVRGAVVVAPALGVTQPYYFHLAEFLAETGFAVLTFDYRGTGRSAPARLRNFETDLFDWSEDIATAIDFLEGELPGLPIAYLGHSLGSQLMGFVRNNDRIAKAVFVASSTWHASDVPRLRALGALAMIRIVLPLSNALLGYSHSLVVGKQGHCPRGPIDQWRRWCLNPEFLGIELAGGNRYGFDRYAGEIVSIWASDDLVVTPRNARKLVAFHSRATGRFLEVRPDEVGVDRIGHIGFLSRRHRDGFWRRLAALL